MQAIDQLKTMRNEALSRLQNNADYRLLTSLDNLIVDLETMSRGLRPAFTIVDDKLKAAEVEETAPMRTHDVEKAFGELTSELDDEDSSKDESDDNEASAVSYN